MKDNNEIEKIPRNINNYRHIINANPNIGNLNWVYKLRDTNILNKNLSSKQINPFNCYNKETKNSNLRKTQKKLIFMQPRINNKTSHLIKRRPGGTTSQTQLNFETNLRSLNNNKFIKNNFSQVEKIYNEINSKNILSGFPKNIKEEKRIKKEINLRLKEIEKISNKKERLKKIKELPQIKWSSFDPRNNNLIYKELESYPKEKSNLNFTRHLNRAGNLPNIHWSIWLRK